MHIHRAGKTKKLNEFRTVTRKADFAKKWEICSGRTPRWASGERHRIVARPG